MGGLTDAPEAFSHQVTSRGVLAVKSSMQTLFPLHGGTVATWRHGEQIGGR